ncbi:RNA polymerase sigma factor [Paenibacillus terreus]|uniref:RNA polymerase sigma factor n=1 Tax=Paenibacillus terreus TaxID=1387834 RepID=A0ABV5B7W3_9BACL
MNSLDDANLRQIITDVLGGDTEKFREIVKSYQRQIFLYCYHMLGHLEEAEDSGQEVFLKAYRNLKKYSPENSFSAWLYRMAYNHCIDVIRRRKLSRYLPFFYRDEKQNRPVEQQIEANYFDEYVHKALSSLTAEERNLLILRCVEDHSYQEIGQILQQNPASLRKKYMRTAAKFRKFYNEAKEEGACDVGQGTGIKKRFS